MPIQKVAALHDLASLGRCSLNEVIPVLSVMGLKVCPVPTAVLSSDTGGFGPVFCQELTGAMRGILEKLRALHTQLASVYSGYLGGPSQTEVVMDYFDAFDGLHLVDPVLGDQGKLYSAFDGDMVRAMRRLCAKAHLITPNLTEAAFLLEQPLPGPLRQPQACRLLASLAGLGCGEVVVTSALLHAHPDRVATLAFDGRQAFAVLSPRIPAHYPGTGDLFASVLLGARLQGEPLLPAVRRAAGFVARCMEATLQAETPPREGVLLEAQLPRLLCRQELPEWIMLS